MFDEAEPGTEFIITMYRGQNSNLRTQLERIIGRAGLKPWPKLFQNLRSTRETELAEQFPLHVVCQWIGSTVAVAAKHYLQVTDEHFARAGQGDAANTESDVKATQIPTSYSAACCGAQKQKPLTESGVMRSKSDCCDSLRSQKVPRRGLQTSPNSPEKTGSRETGGAESGALDAQETAFDADLDWLESVWNMLPVESRDAIVATARKALDGC